MLEGLRRGGVENRRHARVAERLGRRWPHISVRLVPELTGAAREYDVAMAVLVRDQSQKVVPIAGVATGPRLFIPRAHNRTCQRPGRARA